MKAYKLLRLRKNGTLSPLFINKKQIIPLNKWMPAEAHLTKGFAFRPGWHCTHAPKAPHLSKKGRIWCEVEIDDFQEIKRPKSQGGKWFLANKMRINKIFANKHV